MKTVLTLDIGGSFIKYGLIVDGVLRSVNKVKTPNTLDAFNSCLNAISSEFPTPIAGVSISMPGIINADTGFAIHGGSLSFIRQMNVRELYYSIFNCPIAIENDAKSAILGEIKQGQLKGVSSAVMLVIGTGIGGSLVINGKLLRGAHQSAGEVSFLQTSSEMSAADLFGVRNGVYSLLKPFAKVCGKKAEEVDGELFFSEVINDNPDAQAILHDYCDTLAVQLWNLQSIIDPEKIVIGGGISSQSILLEYLHQSIEKNRNQLNIGLFAETISPNVVLSTLGNDANLIGAYVNFVHRHAATTRS